MWPDILHTVDSATFKNPNCILHHIISLILAVQYHIPKVTLLYYSLRKHLSLCCMGSASPVVPFFSAFHQTHPRWNTFWICKKKKCVLEILLHLNISKVTASLWFFNGKSHNESHIIVWTPSTRWRIARQDYIVQFHRNVWPLCTLVKSVYGWMKGPAHLFILNNSINVISVEIHMRIPPVSNARLKHVTYRFHTIQKKCKCKHIFLINPQP